MPTSEDHPLSLSHFFQTQSWYVWNRIAFAREMKLRVSETSITEELLYQFHLAFKDTTIPIRLFESIDEHKNGSDMEILVQTAGGFILLACQAKITYATGNYKSFFHEVGGARQIDLLRDYAKRHGGIANYLLYNYIPGYRMSDAVQKITDHQDHGITYYSADEIHNFMKEMEDAGKKPKTPGFNQFHDLGAKPFHELICDMLRDKYAHARSFPPEKIKHLQYYSEKDVTDASSWRQITAVAKIGFVEPPVMNAPNGEVETSTATHIPAPEFKPKFRIVIGGDANRGGIYRIS